MKRLLFLFALLPVLGWGQTKTMILNKIVVKDTLTLKTMKVTSISADAGMVSPSDQVLPTQKAVRDYVNAATATGRIALRASKPSPLTTYIADVVVDTAGLDSAWVWNASSYRVLLTGGGGGGGTTNLAYVTDAVTGTISNSNGSGVVLPEATDLIAGLLSATKKLQYDAKNSGVQFKDEGSNLGSQGTVTAVDVTGAGATASRSGNTVTINVPGGGGGSPGGSTNAVQYNDAGIFTGDTTFKYLPSNATIEIGKREVTGTGGLPPSIRIKTAFPKSTLGSTPVSRDYIKFDVLDGRPKAANFKFSGENVWGSGETYPNSVMKWGWFGPTSQNASWYAMERSYGISSDSSTAWIENHLSVANVGRSNQETRLFSATTRPNSNWDLARSQWDFRGDIVNLYTVQNRRFASFQFGYSGNNSVYSQFCGTHRSGFQTDSIGKTTSIFVDGFTGTAPSFFFGGFSSVALGGGTINTTATQTLSATNMNVTNTLSNQSGRVWAQSPLIFRIAGGDWTSSNSFLSSGNNLTSVHLGSSNGRYSTWGTVGNTSIGANTLYNMGTSAERNVWVAGGGSGLGISTGSGNTVMGWAALANGNPSKTIAIGDSAMYDVAVSNTLWIETQRLLVGGTVRSAPLISGKFSNASLRGVGIETAPANITSTFVITGSQAGSILSITGDITLNATHHTVIIPTGSAFTATLPSASSIIGRQYRIVNQTAGSKTIGSYVDFSGSTVTTIATATSILVQSDGTNWQRVQ